MTTAVLERFCYAPEGTFGRLLLPDVQTLYTVERPWLDNAPYQSCVPEGDYALTRLPTTTPVPDAFRGTTWYLEGGTVGIDKGRRTRIAIHIANVPSDVAGCIGVGLALGTLDGAWAVHNSRFALVRAEAALAAANRINITFAPGSGSTRPDDKQYR